MYCSRISGNETGLLPLNNSASNRKHTHMHTHMHRQTKVWVWNQTQKYKLKETQTLRRQGKEEARRGGTAGRMQEGGVRMERAGKLVFSFYTLTRKLRAVILSPSHSVSLSLSLTLSPSPPLSPYYTLSLFNASLHHTDPSAHKQLSALGNWP